jgi:hypothetical protein
MNTLQIVTTTDSQGHLVVDVPVAIPNRRVQVLVVWQEVAANATQETPDKVSKAKKRAELEALAGSLADDPLERPPQGTFEAREPIG